MLNDSNFFMKIARSMPKQYICNIPLICRFWPPGASPLLPLQERDERSRPGAQMRSGSGQCEVRGEERCVQSVCRSTGGVQCGQTSHDTLRRHTRPTQHTPQIFEPLVKDYDKIRPRKSTITIYEPRLPIDPAAYTREWPATSVRES